MASAFKTEAQELPFIHSDDMPYQYALKAIGVCMMPVLADGSLILP